MHHELPTTRPAAPARYVYPTEVVPAAEQPVAPAPPPGMRVVGYVRIDNVLHPQYGPLYEPHAPQQPAPAGIDPQAQRTAARGVFALGAGVGAYWGMRALQILVDSLVQLLAAAAVCAVAWAVAGSGRRRGGGPTYVQNNRGFLAGFRSQIGPRR
ncbi:hypothetical protein ACFVY9_02950 [Streptomyces sp. NPDC059544]|uniref:hypothetical protein n=1 Tax=Streptomyces sp. NPDC059544 TaxID=3346861 RepID=UPI003683E688